MPFLEACKCIQFTRPRGTDHAGYKALPSRDLFLYLRDKTYLFPSFSADEFASFDNMDVSYFINITSGYHVQIKIELNSQVYSITASHALSISYIHCHSNHHNFTQKNLNKVQPKTLILKLTAIDSNSTFTCYTKPTREISINETAIFLDVHNCTSQDILISSGLYLARIYVLLSDVDCPISKQSELSKSEQNELFNVCIVMMMNV